MSADQISLREHRLHEREQGEIIRAALKRWRMAGVFGSNYATMDEATEALDELLAALTQLRADHAEAARIDKALHEESAALLRELQAENAELRAERDTLREALRRLHDAVWEYDGPASEEMDAAAGEALAVLGDVISLAPVPEEETT